MASNNNPTGINQHKNCPKKDDPVVAEVLREYHRNGVTNRDTISELLLATHGWTMSPATVSRRLEFLGLQCAGATTKSLPVETRRQLILDQMSQDPSRLQGPATVKEKIAYNTGIHITRKAVREEMHLQDPDAFALREPTVKKVYRGVLHSLGPHHEWSGDGHDKLTSIGFPLWGLRDKWSGKWLGLWVVPNNRLKVSIAYLYLSLVAELGGMPIQSTTDCGSETTSTYGLASSLREYFAPELTEAGMGPAHVFLKSIYNITIERGWLRLKLTWGENVKKYWEAGRTLYNPAIPEQYELVQWLWPTLIQQELDTFRHFNNHHKVRNDHIKMNPSGVAPSVCYELFEKYGGQNCLVDVDVNLVRELMEKIGGKELIQFVSLEYASYAREVYDGLGVGKLTFDNVWLVYTEMLKRMQ